MGRKVDDERENKGLEIRRRKGRKSMENEGK